MTDPIDAIIAIDLSDNDTIYITERSVMLNENPILSMHDKIKRVEIDDNEISISSGSMQSILGLVGFRCRD